ncbi:MAG: HAD family phosphatase [Lachnospiraceae bacterium]|nr:HAD family phosphatase [Lachnospiraceae bacterium]
MKNYKTIVFDVGDVLMQYRWKDMLMDYGLSESEAVRIGNEMFDDPRKLWHQLDLATKTDDEIISEYEEEYPEDIEVIRWFIHHGEYMNVARPKTWKRVHELKEKGYQIYLLSNYSYTLFKRHTRYADFMADIDGMIVSYMIHKAKPEPEIYQTLFRVYDLDPKDCIFFDDRLENVEASIAQGMDAEQVLSEEDLLKKLERF